MRSQHIAGGEIGELHLGGEDPHRDREQRRDHHVVEHRFDALAAVQMAGPDAHLAARIVARRKERQAADVIEMRMAVEEVELSGLAGAHQLVAQEPQPGAAVEDQQMAAAADLDARGVAAVADRVGPRAGDAAAHAPKPHRVIRMDQGPTPSLLVLPALHISSRKTGNARRIGPVARHFENFFSGIALNPSLTGAGLSGRHRSTRWGVRHVVRPITKLRSPLSCATKGSRGARRSAPFPPKPRSPKPIARPTGTMSRRKEAARLEKLKCRSRSFTSRRRNPCDNNRRRELGAPAGPGGGQRWKRAKSRCAAASPAAVRPA